MTGENFCFIVGHYKSGSTWLANLLSLHPDVCGVRETHIFRYAKSGPDLAACTRRIFQDVAWAEGGTRNLLRNRIARWLQPFRRSGQSTLSWSDRPTTRLDLGVLDQLRLYRSLNRCRDADEYCQRFFSFLHQCLHSPTYLVDKTSTNIFFVPDIKRVFPGAKLVAIHRDGRDVMVSDRFHLKNYYGKTQDFAASAQDWEEAVGAELEMAQEYGIHTLSYESLLQDGRAKTEELLDHMGLSRTGEIVDQMLEKSSFKFVTGRSAGQQNGTSFYRKGVAGDWRQHLSREELQRFSEVAGERLVQLGYEESSDWRSWS